MRGPRRWAVAVRASDGSIRTLAGDVPRWAMSAERLPVVRGVIALAASLSLGVRALVWSAEQMPDRSGRPVPVWRTLTTGLVLAVGLFFVLPAAAVHALADGGRWALVVEAVARLGVFLGYLLAVGLLPDVRRVFQYHGAEHMAVAAHEAGDASVEEALTRSTRHDRCGTTFLLLVVVLTAVAGLVIGDLPYGWLLLSRVVTLPFVAGVAYELIRLAGKASGRGRWLASLVLAPGRALQALTTRAPDRGQVEVAVVALASALAEEVVAERSDEPALLAV